MTDEVRHVGGCHCGAVRYEAYGPKVLKCVRCNCSICVKKQHIMYVPAACFKLLKGEECLTTYTYNTHQAKHIFCKICGIHSFYMPRAYPGKYGIFPYCLDEGTVDEIIIEDFDGVNYEQNIESYKE